MFNSLKVVQKSDKTYSFPGINNKSAITSKASDVFVHFFNDRKGFLSIVFTKRRVKLDFTRARTN